MSSGFPNDLATPADDRETAHDGDTPSLTSISPVLAGDPGNPRKRPQRPCRFPGREGLGSGSVTRAFIHSSHLQKQKWRKWVGCKKRCAIEPSVPTPKNDEMGFEGVVYNSCTSCDPSSIHAMQPYFVLRLRVGF